MPEELNRLLSLEILVPLYGHYILHPPAQGDQRRTLRNLLDMVDLLRDLPVPQEDLRVNVFAMGTPQPPIMAIALAMGLNVRVGMKDNVHY